MKTYVGTKTIEAEPLNLGDYNKLRGWQLPVDEDPLKEGYLVIYPDGYKSWSPKEVFESAYSELIVGPDVEDDDLISMPVFPSEKLTIGVVYDQEYGGAHEYQFQNSLGFSDGEAKYDNSYQKIQFVKKNADGTMIPGVQSEQLVIALIDRTAKLNAKYLSAQSADMIKGLNMFLDACKRRVQNRIDRGVMGDLKK